MRVSRSAIAEACWRSSALRSAIDWTAEASSPSERLRESRAEDRPFLSSSRSAVRSRDDAAVLGEELGAGLFGVGLERGDGARVLGVGDGLLLEEFAVRDRELALDLGLGVGELLGVRFVGFFALGGVALRRRPRRRGGRRRQRPCARRLRGRRTRRPAGARRRGRRRRRRGRRGGCRRRASRRRRAARALARAWPRARRSCARCCSCSSPREASCCVAAASAARFAASSSLA